MKGCQCKELLDRIEKEKEEAAKDGDGEAEDEGYSAPLYYVTDEKQSEKLENPDSPCIIKYENEQRKNLEMPNMWTQMNTIQLSINVKKVPEDGEILMFSNYRPDFWKNQPKLIKEVVTAKDIEESESEDGGLEFLFKSTNEIWIITRCKPDVGAACGTFEYDYRKVTLTKPEVDYSYLSIYITIYIGFTMMLVSFLYFEWKCALKCFKNCLARCFNRRRSPNSQVNFDDGDGPRGYNNETKGFIGGRDSRQSSAGGYESMKNQHYGRGKAQGDYGDQDGLDEGIAHGLDRLYSKSKKNEISYGDHGFEGNDYASNRQD